MNIKDELLNIGYLEYYKIGETSGYMKGSGQKQDNRSIKYFK